MQQASFSNWLCQSCCCNTTRVLLSLLLADCSAQLYRTHAYYAAKVAATMPFNVLAALVFSFTVYGMAGLRPGAKYIWQHGVLNTLLSLISVQVCNSTLSCLSDWFSMQYRLCVHCS